MRHYKATQNKFKVHVNIEFSIASVFYSFGQLVGCTGKKKPFKLKTCTVFCTHTHILSVFKITFL